MFNEEIEGKLNEPLDVSNIKQREGGGKTKLSYLTGHHVIEEANRLFGFGNWQTEIQSLKQVDRSQYEKPAYNSGESPKQMIAISYLCQLKVTVKCGDATNSYEDTGFGSGVGRDVAAGIMASIELASKEAVTDALKRCFRYYGNQFGNTLYDKEGSGAMTAESIEASSGYLQGPGYC